MSRLPSPYHPDDMEVDIKVDGHEFEFDSKSLLPTVIFYKCKCCNQIIKHYPEFNYTEYNNLSCKEQLIKNIIK